MSEHTAHCPTCKDESLISDRGLCVWCDTPLRRKPASTGKRPGKPRGKHGKMTDAQIRAAHVLYRRGLSFNALGELLWERYGYSSAKACGNSLCRNFKVLGLPVRDRIAATVAASTKHGNAPKRRTHAQERAYRRFLQEQRGWRAQQGPGQPQCAAIKGQPPARGRRCSRNAATGSDFCFAHDPAREAERLDHLASMRAAAPPRAAVDIEPFVCWLERRVSELGSQRAVARSIGADNSTVSLLLKRQGTHPTLGRIQKSTLDPERIRFYIDNDGTTTFDALYALELAA